MDYAKACTKLTTKITVKKVKLDARQDKLIAKRPKGKPGG